MLRFRFNSLRKSYFFLTAPAGQILYESLVVQAFRPDNLHAMLRKYVLAVMGDNFLHAAEQELDMVNIVENEVILFSYKKTRIILERERNIGLFKQFLNTVKF